MGKVERIIDVVVLLVATSSLIIAFLGCCYLLYDIIRISAC